MNDTSCQFSDGESSYRYEITQSELDNGKANDHGDGHSFRFRTECHNWDGNTCKDKSKVNIQLVNYAYIGSLTSNNIPRANADFKLHIHSDAVDDLHEWAVNQSTKGKIEDIYKKDSEGYSAQSKTFLKFDMKDKLEEKLGVGNHRFIFDIEADSGDGNRKLLRYEFYVGIENRVQITGLQDVSLGTFPAHQTVVQTNFCVYATGNGNGDGGQFGIYAISDNRGFLFIRDPYLVNNGNKIFYKAKVGEGINNPVLHKLNTETVSRYFTGSPSLGCDGNSNMTLQIELVTSFAELSRLPAGSYVDTLWLTVEAE